MPAKDENKPLLGDHQKHLKHLLPLLSNDIPCALWGYNALHYERQSEGLNHIYQQEILVADQDVAAAAELLQLQDFVVQPSDAGYYREIDCANPHPNSVFLMAKDPPKEDYSAAPRVVAVHPQPYFGLDLKETGRFRSVTSHFPPLGDPYAGILVPKFHTLLEGNIYFYMYPPLVPPLTRTIVDPRMLVENLLVLRHKELKAVLKEVTTDVARWFMKKKVKNSRNPQFSQMKQYVNQPGKDPLRIVKSPTTALPMSGTSQ